VVLLLAVPLVLLLVVPLVVLLVLLVPHCLEGGSRKPLPSWAVLSCWARRQGATLPSWVAIGN
jgi:hypothetical protein